jgi:hypothetical protein
LVSEIEPNDRERCDQYALLPAGEVARNFSVIRNRFAAVSLVFFDGCLAELDFLMLNSINMHILFIDIQKYPFHSQDHVKLIDFLKQKLNFLSRRVRVDLGQHSTKYNGLVFGR